MPVRWHGEPGDGARAGWEAVRRLEQARNPGCAVVVVPSPPSPAAEASTTWEGAEEARAAAHKRGMDAALAILRAKYGGVWIDATPKTAEGVPIATEDSNETSGGDPEPDEG